MQITPTQPYLNAQNTKSPRFGSGRATMQTRARQSQVRTRQSSQQQQPTQSAAITKEQIALLNQIHQSQEAVIEQLNQVGLRGERVPEKLNNHINEITTSLQALEQQFKERRTTASDEQVQQVQAIKTNRNVIGLKVAALQGTIATAGAAPPPPPGGDDANPVVENPSPPENPETPASANVSQATATVDANAEANQDQKPKWPPRAERSWKNVPWHMTKQYFGSSKVYWDLAIGGVVGAIAAIGSPVMAVTIPMALAGIATLRVLSIPWKLRQGGQSDIVDEMYKSWEQ